MDGDPGERVSRSVAFMARTRRWPAGLVDGARSLPAGFLGPGFVMIVCAGRVCGASYRYHSAKAPPPPKTVPAFAARHGPSIHRLNITEASGLMHFNDGI